MWTDIEAAALETVADRALEEDAVPSPEFFRSVIDPRSFRENLVDQRVIKGFDVLRRVQFGYARAPSPAEVHHVAFLRPANDRFVVGVVARSGSGRTLRTLSSEQSLVLAVQTMRWRLQDLTSALELSAEWERRKLKELVSLICSQGPNDFDRATIDARETEVTRHARQVLTDETPIASDLPQVMEIACFVGVAAVRELLVCEVPPDDAGVVCYEMREAISELRSTKQSLGDRIASAMGAVPNTLRIPLYKAGKSSGYRLEILVGEGNFIRTIETTGGNGWRVTGTGTDCGAVARRGPQPAQGEVLVTIAEHPSKTMLSAALLAFATAFAAVLGAWLASGRLEVWQGQSLRLGDLATLLGIVAIAVGGIRSVIYRGLEGRALAQRALVSAVCSALLLLSLAVALAWPAKVERGYALVAVSVVAIAAFLAVAIAFSRDVRELAKLRDQATRDHPETPTVR